MSQVPRPIQPFGARMFGHKFQEPAAAQEPQDIADQMSHVYQAINIDPASKGHAWRMQVIDKNTAMEVAMTGDHVEIYIAPTEDGRAPSDMPYVGLVFNGGQLTGYGLGSPETKHIEAEVDRLIAQGEQSPEDIGGLFMMAPMTEDPHPAGPAGPLG